MKTEKTYKIIEEKLNRSWLWHLFGGIIFLLMSLFSLFILTINTKWGVAGIILGIFIVWIFFLFSWVCFSTLEGKDKYIEVERKIKLKRVAENE